MINKKLDAFMCIAGQEHVKRALEVGAVNGSNILLVGPPGAGKLTFTLAYSELVGNGVIGVSIGDSIKDIKQREKDCDYRNALIVADNLPELKRDVILYIKELTINSGLPVIATMHLCPCGYLGDRYHTCPCTPSQINKYMMKVNNLLEVLDIHIEVPSLMGKDIMAMLSGNCHSESMEDVRVRIKKAQDTGYTSLKMHQTATSILETAIQRLGLSIRTVGKIVRIALWRV